MREALMENEPDRVGRYMGAHVAQCRAARARAPWAQVVLDKMWPLGRELIAAGESPTIEQIEKATTQPCA